MLLTEAAHSREFFLYRWMSRQSTSVDEPEHQLLNVSRKWIFDNKPG
jgi:hypothetical protein